MTREYSPNARGAINFGSSMPTRALSNVTTGMRLPNTAGFDSSPLKDNPVWSSTLFPLRVRAASLKAILPDGGRNHCTTWSSGLSCDRVRGGGARFVDDATGERDERSCLM